MIIARIGLLHIGTKTPHPSPPTVTLDQTTQKIIVPGASLGHHPVVIAFGSCRFPQVAVNDCRDTCRDLSFLGALTTAPRSPPRFRTVRFFHCGLVVDGDGARNAETRFLPFGETWFLFSGSVFQARRVIMRLLKRTLSVSPCTTARVVEQKSMMNLRGMVTQSP